MEDMKEKDQIMGNVEKQKEFREPQTAYGTKRQGEYTVEDYFGLPEDQRAELIDGVFYDMASPLIRHQLAAGYIYGKFLEHVAAHRGSCMPMIAPVGVQLDQDDKTMVEPDVLILCDRSKVRRRCVFGAPDFVLEVLSPSTRKKDMFLKLHKYQQAGVREYWMVDLDRRRVIVYDFTTDTGPVIYGFEDQVPVAVWGGACRIDFRAVEQQIQFAEE